MTAYKRVAKNSAVLLGAKAFDAVVGLVTIGLIARYLGVDQFGDYVFVRAFCSVLMIVTNMGVPNIITREVARNGKPAAAHLGTGMWLMGCCSFLSMAFLVIGIELIGPTRAVKLAVYLTGSASILLIFGDLFSAVAKAFERMEFEACQLVAGQSVYLGLVVAVVTLDLGFLSIFVALLLGNLADMLVGAYVALRKFATPQRRLDLALAKETFSQSLPVGLRQFLRKISLRADILLLSFLKSTTEVGYFGSVYRLILNLRVLPSVSSTAVYPIFSRLAMGPRASLLDAYERALKCILVLALPFAVSLGVLARQVVLLIFGEGFLPATIVLRILGVSLSFTFLSTFLLMVLTATDKQKWAMVGMGCCLGTNVLLDLLLIPHFSYVGAAVATLVAEMVLCAVCLRSLNLSGALSSLCRELPKPFISALVMAIGLYVFRNWGLLLAFPLGSLIYLGTLLALRTFSQEELVAIRQVGPFSKRTGHRPKLVMER